MNIQTEIMSDDQRCYAIFDSADIISEWDIDEIVDLLNAGEVGAWPHGILAVWAKDYYPDVMEVLDHCRQANIQFSVRIDQEQLVEFLCRDDEKKEELIGMGFTPKCF